MKNENRGGKRVNAGRKSKYTEKTKIVSFRVPVSFIELLKDFVRKGIKDYEKPNVKKC